MSFYDRLQSANAELQLAKETEHAQKLQLKVDWELETACFMLYKKKLISKKTFLSLWNILIK